MTFGLLVAITFLTLTKVPFVYCDEVYFADPVLNYLSGEGFVSRAWDTSPDSRPVASTSPLYSAVLGVWVAVFGSGLFEMRLLGVVLTAAGLLLLYLGCRRWCIALSRGWALSLLLLVPLMYGYTISYRGGRPEPLVLVLWAAIFCCTACYKSWIRYGATIVLSALVPFAGQVASIALACLAVACAIVGGMEIRRIAGSVIGGLVLGLCAFVGLYKVLGIYPDYVAATQILGGSLPERLIQRLTQSPLKQHNNTIPKDPTMVFLYAALAYTMFVAWRRRTWRARSPLTLAAIYAVMLPPSLYVLAKFPTYYSWMLMVPIAIALFSTISELEAAHHRAQVFARFLVICAGLLGLPLQLGSALKDWAERDHQRVVNWCGEVLKDDDVALVGYPLYFAARKHARKVYLHGYATLLKESDLKSLTVVLMPDVSSYGMSPEALLQQLGPGWRETGERWTPDPSLFGNAQRIGLLSLPNYTARVFRRDPLNTGFSLSLSSL